MSFLRRVSSLRSVRRARLPCLLLALGCAGVVVAAPRPKERIELDIAGVPDEIAENVRGYLTLTRGPD